MCHVMMTTAFAMDVFYQHPIDSLSFDSFNSSLTRTFVLKQNLCKLICPC